MTEIAEESLRVVVEVEEAEFLVSVFVELVELDTPEGKIVEVELEFPELASKLEFPGVVAELGLPGLAVAVGAVPVLVSLGAVVGEDESSAFGVVSAGGLAPPTALSAGAVEVTVRSATVMPSAKIDSTEELSFTACKTAVSMSSFLAVTAFFRAAASEPACGLMSTLALTEPLVKVTVMPASV